MQTPEIHRGLLDEYDRLVTESQARTRQSRELDRLIEHLRCEAADLAERMRQVAQWRDQHFARFPAVPRWLH